MRRIFLLFRADPKIIHSNNDAMELKLGINVNFCSAGKLLVENVKYPFLILYVFLVFFFFVTTDDVRQKKNKP